MKKFRIVVFVLMIAFLSGCVNDSENQKEELWDSIVDTEFSAFNLMGESIYFYEKDNQYYCDFWMSGSGVPAILFKTYEVTFDDEGNIVIDVPVIMIGGSDINNTSVEKVTVEYIDGVIYLKGIKYEDVGWDSRERAMEWVDQAK